MGTLDEKKTAWALAYMVGIYPQLVEEARRHGYALAPHGSLQRDLDLIAVPWSEEAAAPSKPPCSQPLMKSRPPPDSWCFMGRHDADQPVPTEKNLQRDGHGN